MIRTTNRSPGNKLFSPTPAVNLLNLPGLGRFLRWRWSRLVFQALLFLVLALIVYDGLTGPQLAPSNHATVLAWVHYRGLVLLALLLAGNLFCFACPFTIPRTLARRISLAGGRWPRRLRNKWVSIAGLLLIFWLYEWLDLWASPWLTAWLALAYLVSAFVLEAAFSESPFCKYICPLGTFNFVYSTASPLQIQARDQIVCKTCTGKECLNGSPDVPGCGTELFVPLMQSNMDCILCLDCARACPYDNVALSPRPVLDEPLRRRWPVRWDLSFLLVALTFLGFFNAFGMVPPVYRLHTWLGGVLGLQSEALRLAFIFGLGGLALPALVVYGASWLGARLSHAASRLAPKQLAARFSPAFVPLGMGIWAAHYGFHFAIGGLTLIPVFQSFLLDHGLMWFGAQPNWELGLLLPQDWIFPLQVFAVLSGYASALLVLGRRALEPGAKAGPAFLRMLPWALVVTALTVASLMVFNLPMEMRGAIDLGNG